MRTLTRYLVWLHLAQLAAAVVGLTLVLMAAVTLVGAPVLATLDASGVALIAGTAAARCALATLPAAVLVGVVGAGAGLRRRNELVALEACGLGRPARRRVALAVGVAAAAFSAVAARALVPALRRAEHEARTAALWSDMDSALRWLADGAGQASAALGATEARGGALHDVYVWSRRDGQPVVLLAATGRVTPAADGTATVSLRRVQVLGAPAVGADATLEELALDRLDVTLRLASGGDRRRRNQASVGELWEARRAGPPRSRDRIDLELGERGAEALLCVLFAWIGFVIAERTPRRRDVLPYALALVALGVHLLLRPLNRTLAQGPLPAWLVPSLGPAGLALATLALDRAVARWSR